MLHKDEIIPSLKWSLGDGVVGSFVDINESAALFLWIREIFINVKLCYLRGVVYELKFIYTIVMTTGVYVRKVLLLLHY